ncbi:MAG: hypothetical protein R6U38_18170 [Desulfatiglandaceae bacterium]
MTPKAPLSLDKVKSYPLKERKSKVRIENFAKAWISGNSFSQWLDSLPRMLAADDLKAIAGHMAHAAGAGKTIILAMGAHPIKVGLTPVIEDLLERRVISGIAMNGAGIIHDAELAMVGNTSEDVSAEIGSGTFGMAHETAQFLNQAVAEGAAQGLGLGESVGAMLIRENFPHNRLSLLARAHELDIPVTVHVAMGTDIIHIHPSANGAAIGKASHLDFRIFSTLVSQLEGGVLINLGSAVILPEVFLKALSLVRNLGFEVKNVTTVNMDFIRQYRPMTNVVHRPTLDGGRGYSLVGHHEIMFPLLAAAVIEKLNK